MAPAAAALLLLPVLAVFNYVAANGTTTVNDEAKKLFCSDPNGNCTDGSNIQSRRRGHFSKCPDEYKYYCVKGRCRYVVVKQIPACVCESGYTGARCEQFDLFYLRGDQGQVMVISLIAVMALLIILIVFLCICAHHCRKRRRKSKEEEMGTLDKRLPVKTEDVLEMDE